MMRRPSPQPRNIAFPHFIPLRVRFILTTSVMLVLLLGSIALVVGWQQSRSVRGQVEKRGFALAESLAATSKAALLTYNYIALEQAANQAAAGSDIVHIIIHDKEGRSGAYSGRPDLQGKLLEDPLSREAVAIQEPVIRTFVPEGGKEKALEVVFPVFLPEASLRWGTVRVALSLEPLASQIRQIQLVIAGMGILALIFGILLSYWTARRITRPLGQLMDATIEAAQGNLRQELKVSTGDEVEVLAANFSTMMGEILSQRRQLENQLLEIMHLQRYTEKLLETMKDGLISVDMEGRLAVMNPASQEVLGLKGEVVRGCAMWELLSGIPPLLKYLEDLRRSPKTAKSQEQIFIEREGGTQVLLASSSLLADPDGVPLEIITNLHDITEMKKMESRMRQSERLAALGTLAAGMAHEIRNPLSAIKTFVQLLPRKVDKPGFLEKFNRTVPRELERINRLIEDLLELSRSPKYHFRQVDLRTLLEETMELFEEELRSWHIRQHSRISPDIPFVRADPDQLTKAFQNLIRNAVQAMPEGGDLWIEAYRVHDRPTDGSGTESRRSWTAITFRDTGHGISQEHLKSIFNPFFTTKETGTGLGLAITHKVVTEHGGYMDVTSRRGEGTTFTVYFPLEDEGASKMESG